MNNFKYYVCKNCGAKFGITTDIHSFCHGYMAQTIMMDGRVLQHDCNDNDVVEVSNSEYENIPMNISAGVTML